MSGYTGRFAPSPTGALHAGSLVAALASWLDARAHGGTWLVRIEDVDTPRCDAGACEEILRQLTVCGLVPDEAPLYQSQRSAVYQHALDQLITIQAAYPCTCSRKEIEAALLASGAIPPRHGERIYPGTCRTSPHDQPARSWRFHTEFLRGNSPVPDTKSTKSAHFFIASHSGTVHWQDRMLGAQQQNVAKAVGDFVLRRADGLWAYQLAVVVDDALQGITHIVRGEDLADNTARQILLQQALGVFTPQYLHTPLVMAADGHKLSKQNGAQAVALSDEASAINALSHAAKRLKLDSQPSADLSDLKAAWIAQWRAIVSARALVVGW